MHFVLIETAGNQTYIFSTRRRRENAGASELVRRAGVDWVLDGLSHEVGARLAVEDVLDPQANPPIETSGRPEVVYLASGKALLLVPDSQMGRRIISYVTERALRDAPGLQVHGVLSDRIDDISRIGANRLAEIIRSLHEDSHGLRSRRFPPGARSQRLPLVAQCSYGGPAAELLVKDDDGSIRPASREVAAKADWALVHEAYKRMGWTSGVALPEDERSWAAVFHADGNGFGRLFLRFEDHIENPQDSARTFLEKLRSFSAAIDHASRAAFAEAVEEMGGAERAGVLPLVLAGDDLTVHCTSSAGALLLAKRYLLKFKEHANDPSVHGGILREVAARSPMGGCLTASAGVAIVKQHFPFSTAYRLAEELCSEAKNACRVRGLLRTSALSVHVLFDSTTTSLDAIRARLRVDDAHLYGSPYVVATDDDSSPHARWLDMHGFDRLEDAVRSIGMVDQPVDERPAGVPTSQLAAWLSAAASGIARADAAYKLARHRYDQGALSCLEGDDGSLFWKEQDGSRTAYATRALDAAVLNRVGALDGQPQNPIVERHAG